MGRALAAAGVIAGSALLGVLLGFGTTVPSIAPSVEWLATPRAINDFELHGSDGRFSRDNLFGGWTIALLGFRHCPDVCPTSLSKLATILTLLESHAAEPIRVVFVSIDPQRDDVETLQAYTQQFHPVIDGVTGSPEQLDRFASSLGVSFELSSADAIAHSTFLSLIGPDAQLHGLFRSDFEPNQLADALLQATRTTEEG